MDQIQFVVFEEFPFKYSMMDGQLAYMMKSFKIDHVTYQFIIDAVFE